MVIEADEPDFLEGNLVNDNPISDMDASITCQVLRKCFPNLWILQDLSDLLRVLSFRTAFFFVRRLKFLSKRGGRLRQIIHVNLQV